MTTEWNGVSLPDPTDISIGENSNIVQYKTISGVLRTNELSTGVRYNLVWNSVTVAQFGAIYALATDYDSHSITLPLFGTFNVTPFGEPATGDTVGGASSKLNISCSVYRPT